MKQNAVRIDLQNDSNIAGVPSEDLLQTWVEHALIRQYKDLEQTVRVVSKEESRQLNQSWRGKNKPTNILSFPADDSAYLDYDHLGDLVISASVVDEEASQQHKTLTAHWAHMIVHGMLHLQGYDHETDEQAEEMEAIEIEILTTLGHTNPYRTE